MIFIELFLTFFVIGTFTIGGGYAMLSLIQHQVVTEHLWLSGNEFTDIVAISQMTPGPIGINCATYVGYNVLAASGASHFVCVIGSFTATAAVVLPSFLIVLAMCRMYERFRSNRTFLAVMTSLKPAVAGLIGAAAILLVTKDNFPDYTSWILFAASFILAYFIRLNPILIIILGGVAGFLLY